MNVVFEYLSTRNGIITAKYEAQLYETVTSSSLGLDFNWQFRGKGLDSITNSLSCPDLPKSTTLTKIINSSNRCIDLLCADKIVDHVQVAKSHENPLSVY